MKKLFLNNFKLKDLSQERLSDQTGEALRPTVVTKQSQMCWIRYWPAYYTAVMHTKQSALEEQLRRHQALYHFPYCHPTGRWQISGWEWTDN